MKFKFRLRRNIADETTASHTQSRVIGEGRLRLPPLAAPSSSNMRTTRRRKKRSSLASSTGSTTDDSAARTNSSSAHDHDDDDDSSSSDFDDRSFDNQRTATLEAYHMDDIVLGELLGQGTFCTVHAIVCIAAPSRAGNGGMFHTQYALKRLHTTKKFANYQAVVADVATEAWILHALPHPNIVGLHAVVDDDTTPCKALVLDRLHSTLRDERRRWYKWAPPGVSWHLMRKLRPTTYKSVERLRLQVAVELSSALAHLHAHGICHRDVKPSNIGFDSKGTVKLFDFGFARSLPEKAVPNKDKDASSSSTADPVYRLTARMGTWRYMAPEVAKGQPYNLKCDVYSTALVLWEMLVGQKPYADLANASDELKAQVGVPPSLEAVDNEQWQSVLQAAWNAKVGQRWAMSQVLSALQTLQQEFLKQDKQQL